MLTKGCEEAVDSLSVQQSHADCCARVHVHKAPEKQILSTYKKKVCYREKHRITTHVLKMEVHQHKEATV